MNDTKNITYYESIGFVTKKNTKLKYEINKFYRYFYLKSAAKDYLKYYCEKNKKYKISEININKYTVKNGKTKKDLIYKKILR